MTDTVQSRGRELTDQDAATILADWLDAFTDALDRDSSMDLEPLFDADATWRDFMAFPWDFHNAIGRHELIPKLLELAKRWRAADFAVNQEQPPVPTGNGDINAFFDFTTKDRLNRGYIMLVPREGRYVAYLFQTQVEQLQDYPELVRHRRKDGKVYGYVPGRSRWNADREKESSFAGTDPTVLVLGAGHNGLAVAARLGALGVPTLVIDREQRVGDTWRNRYASLALHSVVHGDHMPYLPLPATWTAHTPKDKWADWLESYATLLDLNVWTSTTFLDGQYAEDEQRWTIRVQRGDGSIQQLRPRHFFVAGGLFAGPKIPDIKGMDTFTGVSSHSDCFQDGAHYDGKRALVIGAGVSGHELAHDLCEHGADVTLLQRGSTYVVSFDANHKFWNPLFIEDMTYTADFADQMAYAVPNVRTDPINRELVKRAAEYDKELLDSLINVGFKLNWGPNGTGILGAHMSGKDAYQIDIGASGLVADGKIRLKQGVEVAEVADSVVTFTDGSQLTGVDLIIFATGYHQFWGHIKPTLGHIADRIDKAYGRADDGEYANTWRRSAQPGLWFGTGFIRMARFYTKFTALLIKAIEVGIEPMDPDQPDQPDQPGTAA
ncbi:NAD(P)/FAD-dependent oxidoreductase [Dactylosporangium sp. NPDC005572]|uniref:flavin-containing monooxygenase n=1 Tax=Dactylosporangium sp. NPDC005572 TaxID=3156889 RepID=UPI00339DE270